MGVHKEVVKLSIKNELLQWFEQQGATKGDLLSAGWLYQDYLPTLSRNELKALEEILAEMIEDRILEHVNGLRPTYRLTGKGAKLL